MAKAKKTAAERRAQAKRAAARGDAADAPTATAVGPNSSIPTPSAPPPPPPDLPAPVTASAALQRRPPRSAASPPPPPLRSTQTCPVDTAHPVAAPRARPRDLFALAPATAHSAHPWASVRRRRQRRGRPHRHERQQRALIQAEHERLLWDSYRREEMVLEDLRDACYAALGSLYQSGDIRAYGFATPVPVDIDRLFTPRDERDCFPEVLTAMVWGEAALSAVPPTLEQRQELALELEGCLLRLRPSVWDALVTTHSFLVCTDEHWQQQQLPDMQRCYLAGMHSWFSGDSG
ncbi:hypothetical protein EXIGLDRAFT_783872 [Exidia glandulosa HHB12029]|uniref:Uncharacterized protein n=1 Tax=Exidia glandulosa HHB12029 TaxID=1314781 RepID=A0A166MUD7_EXIGL|nr:hypothetical protein EXIGLDRAFT_783872 [Exidia glandulosa HHB12029]